MEREHLAWPFFEDRHHDFAEALEAWCAANLPVDHGDVDTACRDLVARLGRDGWLRQTAASEGETLDVRMLCLARETLARHDGLADFAFAMQGLGTGAISLFGTPEQRAWLERSRAGETITAFALTEPKSGSDVAEMETSATRDGDGYCLSGEKTWISNGGIADLYCVFARTGEAPGAEGISAFLVPADTPGLEIVERLEVMAPHPLARLKFNDLRLPADALIGALGQGFRIAMSVLDVFRSTVGAAALGFARRALEETLRRTRNPRAVRRPDKRAADAAGPSRRHGARGRCRGAAGLSRRLDQGHGRAARHPRGGDGQAVRHRPGAGGHRPRRATPWRGWCAPRPYRRKPVPRNPRPAHLRGSLGCAEVVIARQMLPGT